MTSCKKYLSTYAEPEVSALETFPIGISYQNCAVIPAYNETDDFLHRFINSTLINENVLLILVINQPDSETDCSMQINLNRQCVLSGKQVWQNNNLSLIQIRQSASHILMIDRFNQTRSIKDDQGVGLARKIGADIACSLIDQDIIISPWICSTDADTHLPDNYFSALDEIPQNTAAAIYSFRHITKEDALSKATQYYELSLRYYVTGLQWAGSVYAFHTIGSILTFRFDAYALVRGFPKRPAGEDFYLLNKLAKLGPVWNIADAMVLIEPRLSDRVPFGTGPAVSTILQLSEINDYHYYHPQLFIELKQCLNAMTYLWKEKEQLSIWYSRLSEPAQYALKALHFQKLTNHIIKQVSDEQQCTRHIEQWFDGFRTLKFIHILQEAFYGSIPLGQAIEEAPWDLNL